MGITNAQLSTMSSTHFTGNVPMTNLFLECLEFTKLDSMVLPFTGYFITHISMHYVCDFPTLSSVGV